MPIEQRQHLILVFGDTRTDQRTVKAREILDELIKQDLWFLPRRSKHLKPGAELLFYQSGTGVVALATLRGTCDVVNADRALLQRLGIYYLTTKLILANVRNFRRPIPLRPLVHDLTFVTNKEYWGHSLRFTPRAISAKDYDRIIQSGRKLGSQGSLRARS